MEETYETESDETDEEDDALPFRFDWRVARCLIYAIVIPGMLSGAALVALDFWQFGPKRLVSYHYFYEPGEVIPNPNIQTIVSVWFDMQLEQTVFTTIATAIIGIPLFIVCIWRWCDKATCREMSIGIACATLAIGALTFLSRERLEFQLHPIQLIQQSLLCVVWFSGTGSWIAWQTWRAVHPEEKFWPRFSLRTLIFAVFLFGVVLAVFAPR